MKLKRRTITPVSDGNETIAYVRPFTVGELRTMEAAAEAIPGDDKERDIRAGKLMLASCVCDENGSLVFTGPDDPAFEEIETPTLALLVEKATEGYKTKGKD